MMKKGRIMSSNYQKYPETVIKDFPGKVYSEHTISDFFCDIGKKKDHVLVVECYPGVDDEIRSLICKCYEPDVFIDSEDIFPDGETLTQMMAPHLTEDRVRGVMFYGWMEDFVDYSALQSIRKKIPDHGKVCIYGVGAGLIRDADTLVYCDMARWEIQLRYRRGMPNFRQNNQKEDPLRKIKRGYFVEWRIADKRKMQIFEKVDWFLDSNRMGAPRMVSGDALREGLRQIAKQPFRLVPYFDPGVWGGQWMKEVCDLPQEEPNYAWSFDGVPEENSLYLRFDDVRIEIPAMDLVLYRPVDLLGMKNYCRFGAEFPIRFDFLDTMGGQNLSLQVHPLTEYIRSHFGMTYTQDESYYILDAKDSAGVFLGLREGVDPDEMADDLFRAQSGRISFPAEKYVNFFPCKKHDHFLIPAGTVHCSAADTMVLEISATPYNFTFKLWDWDRVGLDGLPRPIHIEDGLRNIQWNRTTEWVKENLVNHVTTISRTDKTLEECTGLHEFEFIETRRFTTRETTYHDTRDGFHICNLVDGKEAVIESPENAFEPYKVHYAETFIIPASVGAYSVRPAKEGSVIKFIKAYVRNYDGKYA